MTVAYSNALSRLQYLQHLDAQELGYYDTILRSQPLLNMFPIIPASDFLEDAYYELQQTSAKLYSTRRLNEDNTIQEENEFVLKREPLVIYKTDAQVDKLVENNTPGELDRRLLSKIQNKLMPGVEYDMLNGDGTGNTLVGLKSRLTGEFLVNPTPNDTTSTLNINSSASSFQQFVDLFEFAKYRLKVDPGYRIMAVTNEKTFLGVQSGARKNGANVIGSSVVDLFNQEFPTLCGVPLVMVRADGQNRQMMPSNEGATTNQSSIYLVVVGPAPSGDIEQVPTAVYMTTAADGVPLKEYADQEKRQISAGVDFVCGLRVPPRSAVRIRGLQTTGQ